MHTHSDAGHDKLYHHNVNVGGGGCGMYVYCRCCLVCIYMPVIDRSFFDYRYNFYQDGHADQCFNNTFILGGPRLAPTNVSSSQWADLRGCVPTAKPHCAMAQNPYGGGAAPIMVVRHNTVYNHNQSAGDVQCSNTPLSLPEFKSKCGYDGGTSTAELPSPVEVLAMARPLLGL